MKNFSITFLILFCSVSHSLVRAQDVSFDILELPFSRYGSYIAFSASYDSLSGNYDLFLRDISGKYAWENDEIFKIEASKGNTPQAIESIECNPWLLDAGHFSITYQGTRGVRIRTEAGYSLILTKVKVDPRGWEWYIPISEKQHRIHGGFQKYVLTALEGELKVLIGERTRNRPKADVMIKYGIYPEKKSGIEINLERYFDGWKSSSESLSFHELVQQNKTHFLNFHEKNPKLPSAYNRSALEASYVNWSCVVEPRGIIKRPGMLMSKALMRHIWSWDHMFNALALSYDNPELALDQMLVVFDAQQETGAVSDYINDHHAQIAFVKPPVHGLMFKRMMERNDYFSEHLEEVYAPMVRWTNFWFDYLDDDQDGLPQYNHGCNSGWDNSTAFDIGFALEGPDLSAFLVLQMDVLAEMATKLGKSSEALEWSRRADQLLDLLIKEKWDGEKFVFSTSGDDLTFDKGNSSIRFLPMILGERLPENIRKAMLQDIQTSGHITEFGIATEHPESPLYETDGYWRGPIWAPSTYLITEGIRLCGDEKLATEIAQKFVNMCDKSSFRENFVAVTGEGLRDVGYTWTSSVFLILGHDYLYANQ